MTGNRLSLLALVALAGVVVGSGLAQAKPLRYRWQPKATYRFEATSRDDVQLTAMGMNVNQRFTTTSRFALKVDRVRSNGTAEGRLIIEAFAVKGDSGQTMASLDNLPAGALSNELEIDAKGNFKFKETVYLIVDEESGENVLVSAKASGTSAEGSVSADGEKVTVYAKFDPKTGRLSGGATVEKIAKAKKRKKKVAVKQDAPRVEILPTQFMQMLRLPDDDSNSKSNFTVPGADAKMTVTSKKIDAARVALRTVISSDVDGAQMGQAGPAEVEASGDGGGMGFAMPGGMPGMGGGMPGMPGMGGGEAPPTAVSQTKMKVSGDFTVRFNHKQGRLEGIEGTMSSAISQASMMNMKTTSQLTLAALP